MWKLTAAVALLAAVGAIALIHSQLPAWGAGGLLHPVRQATIGPAPPSCADTEFAGDGVRLRGWRCKGSGPARGTVVYLHGVGESRRSATGAITRLIATGFDVIAYDSRAHGASDGAVCTYGFFEKRDLRKVIDTIGHGPIVLIGTSLGAAVALQTAAEDSRVTALVAAETFSELRTVATERAPFFFTAAVRDRAFRIAEQVGHFDVNAVSPVAAAARITVPVLVIHGATDVETPPSHSERVFAALRGPKRLLLVPDTGHSQSLKTDVWAEIERWIKAYAMNPIGADA